MLQFGSIRVSQPVVCVWLCVVAWGGSDGGGSGSLVMCCAPFLVSVQKFERLRCARQLGCSVAQCGPCAGNSKPACLCCLFVLINCYH